MPTVRQRSMAGRLDDTYQGLIATSIRLADAVIEEATKTYGLSEDEITLKMVTRSTQRWMPTHKLICNKPAIPISSLRHPSKFTARVR